MKDKNSALEKIQEALKTILPIEVSEIALDYHFTVPPRGMEESDPEYDKYLCMYEPDMLIFMIYLQAELNVAVDDTLFAPKHDSVQSKMWWNRPVGDLAEFCLEYM